MLDILRGRVRLLAALAGGLIVVSTAVACRGDSEPTAEALPASTRAETQIELTPAPPTPTLVLRLDSFAYTASLTIRESKLQGEAKEVVVSTEGSFQAPDRHSFTYATQLGGARLTESAVIIGSDAWLRANDDPYSKTAIDDPEVDRVLSTAFSSLRPGFLGGESFAAMRDALQRLTPIAEEVNGIPADHYAVGADGQDFFQSFLAAPSEFASQDLHWELWLARDEGWPVRLLVSGSLPTDPGILQKLGLTAPAEWELRIDISRPNDPAVTVQAPP